MAKRQPGAAMVVANRDIWTVKRMNAMRNEPSTSLRQTLLVCVCGALLALPSATASAEDDDDTFEQKIIKNILGGMGVDVGRPGIDYRERSPLVIPPTRDLPPPQAADVSARNPAWPREPDKKAVARVKPNARATPDEPGGHSVMSPDELRRGTNPRARRVTDPSQSQGSIEEANVGRPVSPTELSGSYSIFSWRSLMGVHLNEQAQFTGEPTRGSLTQPPPGYQTPSSAQPYGVGTDKGSGWKIPTILDRPVGNEQ
jgi:hypothetical protein